MRRTQNLWHSEPVCTSANVNANASANPNAILFVFVCVCVYVYVLVQLSKANTAHCKLHIAHLSKYSQIQRVENNNNNEKKAFYDGDAYNTLRMLLVSFD